MLKCDIHPRAPREAKRRKCEISYALCHSKQNVQFRSSGHQGKRDLKKHKGMERNVALQRSFYFEGPGRKRRVLALHDLTAVRLERSRDGDCGDKQTHAVRSLVARVALQQHRPTSRQQVKPTFTHRAHASEPARENSGTLPDREKIRTPGILSPLSPSLPSCARSRLM